MTDKSSSIKTFFAGLVDLKSGIDREGTILWIQNNKRMRGSNAWLLMCSIMIASLGLDMDSPAIIIGAMLISPLMSPILGVGMSIGMNDRQTLIISLKHFGVSIAIALITSYIYFWINPLAHETATKEIIDRTEPTLLAGIVAIFGGIAGIISASQKDKSNAIPGVAIATALMPPLCVAGYGLARAEYNIFIQAFYLFFLNSFFIAISTFVMIRYMKFPFRKYPNPRESRRTTILIALVSILLIIPSIYILNQVVNKRQQERIVEKFVEKHFGPEQNPQSIGYDYTKNDTSSILAIRLLGENIDTSQLHSYERLLSKAGVENTKIFLLQDETVDLDQFASLRSEISGYKKIVKQLELSENIKTEAEERVEQLSFQLDSLRRDTLPLHKFNHDITALRENIEHIDYGYVYHIENGQRQRRVVFFVKWKKKMTRLERTNELNLLENFFAGKCKGEAFDIVEKQ